MVIDATKGQLVNFGIQNYVPNLTGLWTVTTLDQ
jgi:hypothetical protein